MSASVQIDSSRLNPSDPVAVCLLAQSADNDLVPLIDRLLAQQLHFDPVLIESCLAVLETRGLVESERLAPFLVEDAGWRKSPVGLWLTARLFELRGQSESALAVWNDVIARQFGDQREAHLARARLLGVQLQPGKAFGDLRQALMGCEDFGFLAKAAKLYARLRKVEAPPSLRKARVAILSSSTTEFMSPLLQLACFRDAIDATLYVASYGQIQQEVYNEASALYAFHPDVVIIATHWRDANVPAFTDKPDAEIERVVGEYRGLWKGLLDRMPCRIIQHNFDLPAMDAYGHVSLALPNGRAHMLREVNRQLVKAAPPAVSVLDLDQVSAVYGKREWFDSSYWHLAKQYPATQALPVLVDHQVALIRAGLGLAKKVLVLDLDNTLWGGVIGEDGLEGISLGPPSAAGEAYQDFQRYVRELKDRGVLLAICSKNNEMDAQLPFQKHSAMILRLEDFVVFRANWKDKSLNLREMADQINLGLDSFVFLDDNPVERALVHRELPEVAVPELGHDPSHFIARLDRERYFEVLDLSPEDYQRHESYRANVLRDNLRQTASSLDDFLRNLGMESENGPFNDLVLARVVQLVGKTNQFNLTTCRYSEGDIRRMTASSDCWTRYFKLKDRFGDNGLVGVMMAHRDTGETLWTIDTWLMSCRVIGRQFECFMFSVLADALRARGALSVRGVYKPTAKNAMVADLYSKMGFTPIPHTAGTDAWFEFDLAKNLSSACAFIQNLSQ